MPRRPIKKADRDLEDPLLAKRRYSVLQNAKKSYQAQKTPKKQPKRDASTGTGTELISHSTSFFV